MFIASRTTERASDKNDRQEVNGVASIAMRNYGEEERVMLTAIGDREFCVHIDPVEIVRALLLLSPKAIATAVPAAAIAHFNDENRVTTLATSVDPKAEILEAAINRIPPIVQSLVVGMLEAERSRPPSQKSQT